MAPAANTVKAVKAVKAVNVKVNFLSDLGLSPVVERGTPAQHASV